MTTQPTSQRVGGYELLAKLGEGGMGVVHLARRDGGQRVAVKVLRPHIVGDDEARARLAREVSSLSRIRSRWVAEIVDADPWAPIPYVATRYVPGLALHDHVVEEGPITGPDLTWFAACLARGVASVHDVGVLHRDIKPSNVLMEGRTPILIDFGLARVADDPKLTHTGYLLGTPGYLAPEILYGDEATTASDVHSWAATIVYAATGRPPFGRGPGMAIMDRVRRGEHDLSGIDEPMRLLLAAALDPEPSRRPSLDQILEWLEPQTLRADLPQPSLSEAVPQTVPLVALHREAADGVTDRFGTAAGLEAPAPGTRPYTRYAPAGYVPAEDASELDDDLWADPELIVDLDEPRASAGERLRRAILVAVGAGACGLAVAAAPWLATAALLVAVWLLRSASLAASAVSDRRRLRGRKWHDGPRFLASAPWHLVRSIPSTALLFFWALGLAAVGGLLCYAVAAPTPMLLTVCGVLAAAGCWFGPGGSRVRGPVARALNPIAAGVGSWTAGLAALLALGVVGALFALDGPNWTPAQQRPLHGQHLRDLVGMAP